MNGIFTALVTNTRPEIALQPSRELKASVTPGSSRRDRDPARLEPALPVQGHALPARLRRGHRPVRLPDAARAWRIVVKWRNPWWYPPNSPWAKGEKPDSAGAGNPLGTRWMGLSASGVGIHGTPDDASIGYSASHGCIRMHIPGRGVALQPRDRSGRRSSSSAVR
jgi:lipoprotein-anchoring transpeptidase ErfK/SrfK